MPKQLTFDWKADTSYAAEDFIPSPVNEEALAFISAWPETTSPTTTALLVGHHGTGKTHLATMWQERTHAISIDALNIFPSDHWWQHHPAALLENIDSITDEARLFHLLRHAELHNHVLLLTSSLSAPQLAFTLPDLCSRLKALPSITLNPPDDALLHMFCLKFFADHQQRVTDEVIAYLVKRTERNFAYIQNFLTRLIRKSISEKREITIPWLRSVLTFI